MSPAAWAATLRLMRQQHGPRLLRRAVEVAACFARAKARGEADAPAQWLEGWVTLLRACLHATAPTHLRFAGAVGLHVSGALALPASSGEAVLWSWWGAVQLLQDDSAAVRDQTRIAICHALPAATPAAPVLLAEAAALEAAGSALARLCAASSEQCALLLEQQWGVVVHGGLACALPPPVLAALQRLPRMRAALPQLRWERALVAVQRTRLFLPEHDNLGAEDCVVVQLSAAAASAAAAAASAEAVGHEGLRAARERALEASSAALAALAWWREHWRPQDGDVSVALPSADAEQAEEAMLAVSLAGMPHPSLHPLLFTPLHNALVAGYAACTLPAASGDDDDLAAHVRSQAAQLLRGAGSEHDHLHPALHVALQHLAGRRGAGEDALCFSLSGV